MVTYSIKQIMNLVLNVSYFFHNSLGDSGVTKDGCAVLAAALNSNPSYLRELDLSSNELTDAGMRLLSPVLRNHSSNIVKLE